MIDVHTETARREFITWSPRNDFRLLLLLLLLFPYTVVIDSSWTSAPTDDVTVWPCCVQCCLSVCLSVTRRSHCYTLART